MLQNHLRICLQELLLRLAEFGDQVHDPQSAIRGHLSDVIPHSALDVSSPPGSVPIHVLLSSQTVGEIYKHPISLNQYFFPSHLCATLSANF